MITLFGKDAQIEKVVYIRTQANENGVYEVSGYNTSGLSRSHACRNPQKFAESLLKKGYRYASNDVLR